MLKGTYIGRATSNYLERDGVANLHGKTALLKEIPGDTLNIEAQFDDMELEKAYHWHRYRRTEFKITWNERDSMKAFAEADTGLPEAR